MRVHHREVTVEDVEGVADEGARFSGDNFTAYLVENYQAVDPLYFWCESFRTARSKSSREGDGRKPEELWRDRQ